MKRIVFIIMVCLTTVSLGSFAQDKKAKKSNKEKVTFDVSMTCENCKKKIEKNIPFEKGVSDMKVDLLSKTVMVQFNPNKTNKEKLQRAFEDLGYVTKERIDSVE
ncbi:cation transporter [Dysgonomonas sp. OttesenSCG-928-M03]|nr:cation transporter [Dysgonomonas sp. OttesenSCG-928-M03]